MSPPPSPPPPPDHGPPTVLPPDPKHLPYHEPEITILLIYASFILLLNVVNTALNHLLYCGLIGQILVGIAWGAPGANWLSHEAQETIVQLGYLGLILLVYEGGLSTSLTAVRQNIWVSIAVALTGLCLPIALSFVLMPLLGATPVQAFAAGAMMSVTGLGTTFTMLSTCNLTSTRLGTVLATAAMLDDVIGLVMLQVVTEIGVRGGSIEVTTLLRPIGVSVAVVLALIVSCRYLVKPLARRFLVKTRRVVDRVPQAALVLQSLFLLGIFAGVTYAGASGLFAAWLAGATMVWWDTSCVPGALPRASNSRRNATEVFESSYASVTNLLLKPFFFASIGFAIPISEMFDSGVVWRGFVYAAIMLLARLVSGLWLVRFTASAPEKSRFDQEARSRSSDLTLLPTPTRSGSSFPKPARRTSARDSASIPSPADSAVHLFARPSGESGSAPSNRSPSSSRFDSATTLNESSRPISLYPWLLLGLAMTQRGEIGFLIASVAESSGIFSNDDDTSSVSRSFLVVIWAVSLCTLIGPISVGFMIRRVRSLERNKGEQAGRQEVLGVWGVDLADQN